MESNRGTRHQEKIAHGRLLIVKVISVGCIKDIKKFKDKAILGKRGRSSG
jgi:hypothetical protein